MTPRAVFPYLSTGPDARHHGRFGPEEPLRSYAAALFVDNGTGMYMAGFPGYAAPRAVFLCFRLAQDAPLHGRFSELAAALVVDSGGIFMVGFTGDDAPRAVLFFLVVRPKMLGIMAGLDQKDSCLEEYRKTGCFST